MKIIDKPLIFRIREQAQGRCEFCFSFVGLIGLETHHIFSRGAGRIDIPGNLIALCGPWANDCHGKAQRYQIHRAHLLHVTATREHTSPEAIALEVYRLRRAHKYAEVRRDA